MKRNNSNLNRIILFFLGIIIILLSEFMMEYTYGDFDWRMMFAGMSILVMYVFAFAPLCFKLSSYKKTGNIIIGGAIYYKGCVAYIVLSIGNIVRIFTRMAPLVPAIIIQLIILFIFVLYVYMASASTNHIADVKDYEDAKTSQLNMLKDMSRQMMALADSSNKCDAELKNKIKAFADNMRFLSPTDNTMAGALEKQMLSIVHQILNSGYLMNGNDTNINDIKRMFNDLDCLYQQRKAVY